VKLKLIKKVTVAKDTISFYFTTKDKIIWQPGQYLVIKINEIEREFTIASSPTEEFIQITIRMRELSIFKNLLNNLEIDSEVEANGPFGSFIFPTINSSLLTINYFLAGGIGITPFRSMIKYNIDRKLGIKMHLIYSNSDSEFVFKEELDQLQKENDFIKIKYIDSSVDGRIDKLKIEELIGNWKLVMRFSFAIGNCAFSAVGPNAFVNSMEDILEDMKIPQDQIHTEKFTGY
jgi:ferredoxin-NADP reductase